MENNSCYFNEFTRIPDLDTYESISKFKVLESIDSRFDTDQLLEMHQDFSNWFAAYPVCFMTSLDSLYRKYDSILGSVDLISEDSNQYNYSHMIGVLTSAIEYDKQGYSVVLIESCTRDFVSMYSDIDLVLWKNGDYYFIDLTLKEGFSHVRDKTSKLMDNGFGFFKLEKYTLIRGLPPILELKHNHRHSEQIDKMDYIVDSVRSMTLDELLVKTNEIVDNPLVREELLRDHKKIVKKWDVKSDPEKSLICVKNNSPETAKLFQDILVEETCSDIDKSNYERMQKNNSKWCYDVEPLEVDLDDPYNRNNLKKKMDKYTELGGLEPFVENVLYCLKGIDIPDYSRVVDVNNVVEVKLGDKPSRYFFNMYEQLKLKGKTHHDLQEHTDLERSFSDLVDYFSEEDENYLLRANKDILSLNRATVIPNEVSVVTGKMIESQLKKYMKTNLGLYYLQIQSIAEAITSTLKVAQRLRRSKGKSMFIVENIVGFDGFLVTNLSNDYQSSNNHVCFIVGTFKPTSLIIENNCFFRKHDFTHCTQPYTITASDLDWGISLYSKFLSFSTMQESMIETFHTESSLEDDLNVISSCMFMYLNDAKFAQVAEMVRYLYINATSLSSGSSGLFEKIKWYKPKDNLSKLYYLRMCKMTICLEIISESGYKWRLKEDNQSSDTIFSNLMISFPQQQSYVLSDNYNFNSMYICKLLSLGRYDKGQSQSQVFMKQLKNRRMYTRLKYHDYTVEKNYQSMFEDILNTMKESSNWITGGLYRPSIHSLTLMLMVNAIDTLSRKKTEGSMDDIRVFDEKKIVLHETIDDIMNTRGSVADIGDNGHHITRSTIVYNKKKKQNEKKSMTLSDKCYSTLLVNKYQQLTNSGSKYDPNPGYDTSRYLGDKEKLEGIDFSILMRGSSNPISLWINNLVKDRPSIARMVEKDQIGPREIAVLNSNLRVNCYMIERIARKIKVACWELGDKSNMIGDANKDDNVTKVYQNLDHGLSHTFDNADCSQWGPSMLSYVLYSSIALRMKRGTLRSLVKMAFKAFSSKCIKIPDDLLIMLEKDRDKIREFDSVEELKELIDNDFMGYRDPDGKNSEYMLLARIITTLRSTKDEELGNFSLGFLHAWEGMFQGTLNDASSIFASDVGKTTKYVTERMLKLEITQFYTSDDYSRIITQQEDNLSNVTKCVNIHNKLSLSLGVKRNMYKSTISKDIFEFNSVFRTTNGIHKPEIKSRLSYIAFSPSVDPYEASIDAISNSLEYLRGGGSVVGSQIIYILRAQMFINQFNLRILIHNDVIFKIPLEVGGIARFNSMLHCSQPLHTICSENYTTHHNFDMYDGETTNLSRRSMERMYSYLGDSVEEVEIEDESGRTSKISIARKSGVVKLVRRVKKSFRRILSYMEALPEKIYTPSFYRVKNKSIIKCLISCTQREVDTETSIPERMRCIVPQTPLDADVYLATVPSYKAIFGTEKFSHRKLLEIIIRKDKENFFRDTNSYLTESAEFILNSYEHMRVNIAWRDTMDFMGKLRLHRNTRGELSDYIVATKKYYDPDGERLDTLSLALNREYDRMIRLGIKEINYQTVVNVESLKFRMKKFEKVRFTYRTRKGELHANRIVLDNLLSSSYTESSRLRFQAQAPLLNMGYDYERLFCYLDRLETTMLDGKSLNKVIEPHSWALNGSPNGVLNITEVFKDTMSAEIKKAWYSRLYLSRLVSRGVRCTMSFSNMKYSDINEFTKCQRIVQSDLSSNKSIVVNSGHLVKERGKEDYWKWSKVTLSESSTIFNEIIPYREGDIINYKDVSENQALDYSFVLKEKDGFIYIYLEKFRFDNFILVTKFIDETNSLLEFSGEVKDFMDISDLTILNEYRNVIKEVDVIIDDDHLLNKEENDFTEEIDLILEDSEDGSFFGDLQVPDDLSENSEPEYLDNIQRDDDDVSSIASLNTRSLHDPTQPISGRFNTRHLQASRSGKRKLMMNFSLRLPFNLDVSNELLEGNTYLYKVMDKFKSLDEDLYKVAMTHLSKIVFSNLISDHMLFY
jgi:hypothetical protein